MASPNHLYSRYNRTNCTTSGVHGGINPLPAQVKSGSWHKSIKTNRPAPFVVAGDSFIA
jgi:hypothetical protein